MHIPTEVKDEKEIFFFVKIEYVITARGQVKLIVAQK